LGGGGKRVMSLRPAWAKLARPWSGIALGSISGTAKNQINREYYSVIKGIKFLYMLQHE
jgi:hypothetical protein